MTSLSVTIAVSVGIFLLFFIFQLRYFFQTRKSLDLYKNFFSKEDEYKAVNTAIGDDAIPQLVQVGESGYDLNKIISEINHYIVKTKGTTDFSIIQNKVERKLAMRYDQTTAKLSFPTNIGLMGTFFGVFLGILMFVFGFDGVEELRDIAIRNLLIGVLISMATSFFGLLFTTYNSGGVGEAQKKVEEDKNELYDFIQTELMPSLDVSLVVAITKLHETVDEFEPAFEKVINKFQETFDRCTKAFGNSFEKNVTTVSNAVDVMGKNMDKINENIELQKSVISTFKSEEVVRGLEKYVEAADHFVGITQSLNKFEEARRMMLAAAQEAINLQNAYSESLIVPKEVALRINQILDRVKNFEANIEKLGDKLNEREILGNDVVNAIRDQVNGIEKKNKIAESYLQKADGDLEDLFSEQTKVIGNLNNRYAAAINSHIEGFEDLMDKLSEDIKTRHKQFLHLMEDNLNVEMIHEDFSNLSKLDQLSVIREDIINLSKLEPLLAIKEGMDSIFDYLESTNRLLGSISFYQQQQNNTGEGKEKGEAPVYVPTPSISDEEVRRVRKENQELRINVQTLTKEISQLVSELKIKQGTSQQSSGYSTPQSVQTSANVDYPQTYYRPASKPNNEGESPNNDTPYIVHRNDYSSKEEVKIQTSDEDKQEDGTGEAVEEKRGFINWWPFKKKR